MKILISKIKPSRRPVRSGQDGSFDELVESIKRFGQVVPIKVRKSGDAYEVVYGNRRLRAAKRAGLNEIEAIVESVDDKHAYSEAYIENMIREGMTPREISSALHELSEVHGGVGFVQLARLGYGAEGMLKEYWPLASQPTEVQRLFGPERGSEPLTTRHFKAVRTAGLATPTRDKVGATSGPDIVSKEGRDVLKKAKKEDLTAQQTGRVAEAVAVAKSPEMREHLLKTPYSGLLHDKRLVEQRPRVPAKAAIKKDWSLTPEVSRIIDILRTWEDRLDGFKDAADQGKFSPEAGRFVAQRMRKLASAIMLAANHIERKSK